MRGALIVIYAAVFAALCGCTGRQLDKRYRSKYGMSMLGNLEYIRDNGINKFVKKETKRWRCRKCGSLLSCHRDSCIICGFKKPKMKIK